VVEQDRSGSGPCEELSACKCDSRVHVEWFGVFVNSTASDAIGSPSPGVELRGSFRRTNGGV
jgi:hypothetical protein